MVRRSGASHFVPDAYVFPGGTVDPSDYAEELRGLIRGTDEQSLLENFRMRQAAGLPAPVEPVDLSDAAAITAAALRELYEESGVLLACDAQGAPSPQSVSDARVPFADALKRGNAFADARGLALFSHWITPPTYPKRYNTHFFLAQASGGQHAIADATETHDGVWIAPAQALNESQLGRFTLVYPTIKHLERLAAFEDADQLMRFARSKPVYSIMPASGAGEGFSLPSELEMAW